MENPLNYHLETTRWWCLPINHGFFLSRPDARNGTRQGCATAATLVWNESCTRVEQRRHLYRMNSCTRILHTCQACW